MSTVNHREQYFRLIPAEKKEYTYSIINNSSKELKNEYGYSLIKFYDTDITFFEKLLSDLENNISIKTSYDDIKNLDEIFTSFKDTILRIVDAYSKKLIIKGIIENYYFLHRLLELDFASLNSVESRYNLAIKNMTKQEINKYFNVAFSSKMFQFNTKLPVIGYSLNSTLTSLVSIYLCDIISRGATIQKCKHCGRPFFPMGKAIYCDRVLYVKDNKEYTCKHRGAYTSYDESLYIDDLKREYRRVYKRYFARTKLGKLSKENFQSWSVSARKLLKLAEENKISYDEFHKRLLEY